MGRNRTYLGTPLAHQLPTLGQDIFGPGALSQADRLTPSGPLDMSLEQELTEIVRLFDGAADTVCYDIGLSESLSADATHYLAWQSHADDLDLHGDVRMMVPVYHDFQRGKTKVWAVLGWTEGHLSVFFRKPPLAHVFDTSGHPADHLVDLKFGLSRYPLVTPEFAEVLVTRILDRDEFRAHCDRYQTRSAILKNLE